jgi:transposase
MLTLGSRACRTRVDLVDEANTNMPNHELDDLSHRSREIGPLPVVQHFFKRLGLDELLATYVPERRLGRQASLANSKTLAVMVANILTSREPLYAVPDWLRRRVVEHVGLDDGEVDLINDDRIGRALDRVYETDPASLMTAVVMRAVKEFEIDVSQVHSDTTTVTFSGAYEGQKDKEQLKRPPLITFGHNKDHRPDLKQLVYALVVSADGAVPVHYKTYDGNKSDDKTHIEIWKAIRAIAGRSDFFYVADSKLCTRENMGFIAGERGIFLTVLPRSRQEDDAFRAYIQDHPIPWQEVRRVPDADSDKPDHVHEAFEPDAKSVEGYRVVWYRSTVKARIDEKRRSDRIARSKMRIEHLEQRTGAHRYRTVEAAQKAADKVLQDEGAQLWLRVQIREIEVHDYKQASPGQPGKNTKYRRIDIPGLLFEVTEIAEAIVADAKCDGLFAMVTNRAQLDPKELLAVYKYQPFLEKRNEQLKSVMAIAPVFLKKPERVSALLFLYFLAVLVFALIEREARRAMVRDGIEAIPLYPESRMCKAPTCDGILQAFEGIRKTDLLDRAGTIVKAFCDPLSPVAIKLLQLLHVSRKAYQV